MPEKYIRDSSFAFTVDSNELWNKETYAKCSDIYSKLGWELGRAMPDAIMPSLRKLVSSPDFHEQSKISIKHASSATVDAYVKITAGQLEEAGRRIKSQDFGTHPSDPPASLILETLQDLLAIHDPAKV